MKYILIGGNNKIQKVTDLNIYRNQLKNVILCLIKDNKVLMIRENRLDVVTKGTYQVYGLPGGGIDDKDTDLFSAIQREYKEEMGTDIPEKDITKYTQYIYEDKTALFMLRTNKEISYDGSKVINNRHGQPETVGFDLVPITQLMKVTTNTILINGCTMKIRSALVKSLPTLVQLII